ncbi:MAG: GxxExxY protein [Chloroflexi bacterium]|nr:GxxExxY protein [Chloroflexota bacterium]
MSLLHEEQTYQLRGPIFEVRNELQAGWSEHIYHHALERLLRNHGIQFESKPRRALVHRNSEVHTFEPDLIVWDSIILELKVLPYQNNFASEHYAQLIHLLEILPDGFRITRQFRSEANNNQTGRLDGTRIKSI